MITTTRDRLDGESPDAGPDLFRGAAARARLWWSLVVAIAALGFAARLTIMLPRGLTNIGTYDDGVYYTVADALIHGRLPYRDYLFLQPPGVVFAGAPFAWFGSMSTDQLGLVAARIAFMVVGAVNTALITVVLRRFGVLAAVVGGMFYAVGYMPAYTERSLLLEPIGTTGVLVALVVLSRPTLRVRGGWLLIAGLALGVACGFKIWFVAPAALIVAAFGRGWWRVLAGLAAGGALVYLPLFVPAPAQMFRQVVLDQVARGETSQTLMQRLQVIVGDYRGIRAGHGIPISSAGISIVLAVLIVVAMGVVLTVRGARLYVLLFAVNAAILLLTPAFFPHYVSLTMPMLALVVGMAVGRVFGLIPRPATRLTATAVVLLAFVLGNAPYLLHGVGRAIPVPVQRAVQRTPGCLMTDDPTILAVGGVLSRELDRGCPLTPDLTGWAYDADQRAVGGRAQPLLDDPAWQGRAVRYLTSGSAVIVLRTQSQLTLASRHAILGGPVLFRDGDYVIHATR